MSNINLLPWRTDRTFYKNNIFYATCSAVAILSVFFVLVVNVYMKILMVTNKNSVDYINSEISLYQGKTKEINGLKERKKLLLTRLEVINSLQSKRSHVVNILDKLVKSVPDGLVLNQIEMKESILTVHGKSESNSRVSLFMRNLEKLKLFSNPTLQEIKAPENQQNEHNISFVLEVHVIG